MYAPDRPKGQRCNEVGVSELVSSQRDERLVLLKHYPTFYSLHVGPKNIDGRTIRPLLYIRHCPTWQAQFRRKEQMDFPSGSGEPAKSEKSVMSWLSVLGTSWFHECFWETTFRTPNRNKRLGIMDIFAIVD